MSEFYNERLDNASFGRSANLRLTSWPAAAQAQYALLTTANMPRLIDLPNLPDGTYYARVPIGGLSSVSAAFTATFGAGSVTVTGATLYAIRNNEKDSQLDTASFTDQAFTGTGALVTATKQVSTVTTLHGEQYGLIKIVIAGGASPVFSQAETFGPR